jgi:hypothetical protein
MNTVAAVLARCAQTRLVDRRDEQLREELRLRQRRLGTVDEQLDDLRCVCDLAHRIANRLTTQALREAMGGAA